MPTADNQRCSVGLDAEQLRSLLNVLDGASPHPDGHKRRSRRLPYRSLRVQVSVLDQHHEVAASFSVPTRNVSAHGLAFLHKQMMAPGQRLRIEIPLLDGEPIRTLARVVRCRHLRGMVHEIGVEFVTRPLRAPKRHSGSFR